MGGLGSGSYYRGTKTSVNDCRCLDINRMVKLGSIPKSGYRSGRWVWTDAETGEEKSNVAYEADTRNPAESFLRIHYTFTHSQQKIDYKVRLARSRGHYGGERLWFICPSTGHRVAKLYLHPGGDIFASRHAYRLSYACQSEAPKDRAIRKMWKFKNRLGGYSFPEKPKGMHKTTFGRLLEKAFDAEELADGYFAQAVMRFGSRLSGR